jgi:ABC-2 type transport system permease protein
MNALAHRAPLAAMLRHEVVNETRRILRDPGYTLPSIGFPLAFYLLFTFVLPFSRGRTEVAEGLFINYLSFGVIGAMLFGTALPLARDRTLGVLKLKRTTPQPFAVYVAGKLAAALMLAAAVFAIMSLVAGFAGKLSFDAATWSRMVLVQLLGALSSGATGLAIGAWFRDNAAPGVVNLWFMPTAALGGLWFPLALMPAAVQMLALLLPTFHIGELARWAAGAPAQAPWLSLIGIAGWGAIGVLLSAWGLRRQPF